MGNISIFPTGPQTGNRLGSQEVVQSNKDVIDQLGLNSTINRINNIKAQIRAVPQEGKRVADAVQEKGRTLAATGSDRADQLRNIVSQSISDVQRTSSADVSRKSTLIQAINTPNPVEAGKGINLNFSA